MASDAADEVAGAGGVEGDDVVAGLEGVDGAGGAAGVVASLADLDHIVRRGGVLEDDLITRVELLVGHPVAVVGVEGPRTARLANTVGRRRRGAQ